MVAGITLGTVKARRGAARSSAGREFGRVLVRGKLCRMSEYRGRAEALEAAGLSE